MSDVDDLREYGKPPLADRKAMQIRNAEIQNLGLVTCVSKSVTDERVMRFGR